MISTRSSPVSIFLQPLKYVAIIIVYIWPSPGYPTVIVANTTNDEFLDDRDNAEFIESKIGSSPTPLTLAHFAATTVEGEHFCNSFKLGILLPRADFKTTRKVASCHVNKWIDKWDKKEFPDPDLWMAVIHLMHRNEVARNIAFIIDLQIPSYSIEMYHHLRHSLYNHLVWTMGH
jgi:hypothetical protein